MDRSNVDELVRSIVQDTNASPETVLQIYSGFLAEYEHEAKVKDYIPLFVAKRVHAYFKSDFA